MSDTAAELLRDLVGQIYYRDLRDEQRHPFLVNAFCARAAEVLQRRDGGETVPAAPVLRDVVDQLRANEPAYAKGRGYLPAYAAALAWLREV